MLCEEYLDVVARFSRQVASERDPAVVLEQLAQLLSAHAAEGTVVYRVSQSAELQLVAECCADGDRLPLSHPNDAGALRAAVLAHTHFRRGCLLPLVTEHALYGVVLLLYSGEEASPCEQSTLAAALVDIASAMLARDHRYAQLREAYDELAITREALVRAERLRALGQLAAGLSHDLQNALAPALMHAQLAQRKATLEEAVAAAAQIERILRDAQALLRRLKDFGRQSPATTPVLVALDAVAREVVELMRPRARGAVQTLRIRTTPAPRVRVEREELVAAIINLVVNALDATGEGGTVEVVTGGDDERAWVEVRDDGPGIPPEVRDRIFEPFFTTKGERGTGLGLSTVYSFTRRNAGDVAVEVRRGGGTCMRLTFPAAEEAVVG